MVSSCFTVLFNGLLSFTLFFQSDILDVNEIFKDLGTMIQEQGETIG